MFDKVLIANRGEIACRIVATCRRLGIATVAVYSEADARARHVRLADESVLIGPAPAAESYLRIDRILEAASATGAGAVHPGYGFLAENAALARACADAGIVFIGPRPETIGLMGSKSASKQAMEAAGVPTVPGYHGEDQTIATLAREAERVGFPLLVKASAGGGGKGMRIVHAPDELASAVSGAQREAKSAFGDDRLLIERFLERPRHIEFQVFGDAHGGAVHLFERECSIQRRYQKIVEETPSPFLDDALRARMGTAAVTAARSVDYLNAGTVEFIVGEDRAFYFMEMNTRLQVEHPVTEGVTGLDLVEWQLRVAAGEPLPLAQQDILSNGHAIEARVYAERPGEDFLPSTGQVAAFVHPPAQHDVRIDSGVDDGDEISIHYDPMIAKIVCRGEDRIAAVQNLRATLAGTAVFGVDTNLELLRRIARHERFAEGSIDTGYIDRHLEELLAPDANVPDAVWGLAAARHMLDRRDAAAPGHSPWLASDGWQANGRTRNRLAFEHDGQRRDVLIATGRDGALAARTGTTGMRIDPSADDPGRFCWTQDGVQLSATVWRHRERYFVSLDGLGADLCEIDPYAVKPAEDDEESHPGSPMPGRIVAVQVEPGQRVRKNDALLVLEGMKMEFTVRARCDGRVEHVLFALGDTVEAEVPLVDITPDEAA